MLINKFDVDLINLPELETETINGKRHYVVDDNGVTLKIPSVTTILDGTSDKTYLDQWKKNVGEAEANRISAQARVRGTALHDLCEKYVTNRLTTKDTLKAQPHHLSSFIQIKKALDEHAGKIRFVEGCLWSSAKDALMAGRCDLICEWDGKLSVVDYKTSSKIKSEYMILDYFLQATMYSFMFYLRTGILITDIVIVICVDDLPEAQVFKQKINKYIPMVKERIRQYNEINTF